MMEIQTPHSFDWAHDAYVALNDPDMKQQHDNWPPFTAAGSMNTSGFTIPPSLLTHATIERFGQVTPPEELSPTEPRPNSAREDSIPVDELRNETSWSQHQANATQSSKNVQSSQQNSQEPSTKRRKTSRQTSDAKSQASNPALQQGTDDGNPQAPKRKRGRPKSQPQMVEAFTADGFPFQVSSARQSHLEKNRVAAHKCRQRKKEYINGLEGRAREFSSKNKALKENIAMLREEVLSLKNEVLRHAGCGFWAVDEYLARCAGDLLGMEAPAHTISSHHSNEKSLEMPTTMSNEHFDPLGSAGSSPIGSSPDDEFGGLELLRDYEDEDMDRQE
ncbi:Nn.00g105830.m01.CDS01 [Neocucurbitaria sp. VM-36]